MIAIASSLRLGEMISAHLSLSLVRHIVLDEADRMLDMGFSDEVGTSSIRPTNYCPGFYSLFVFFFCRDDPQVCG